MIRLNDLKLPLHHADEALPAAIRSRLRITPRDLIRFNVVRRGHDARDKSRIQLVYALDVAVKNEAAVLARFKRDRDVGLSPDTTYRHPITCLLYTSPSPRD